MLKTIDYNLKFKSTGTSIAGSHDFFSGMTAITGPNESGKSLIVEMIRYSLFGTKALRASVSSYETLSTKLTFGIATHGEDTFEVVRSKSGAVSLKQNNKPLASGTKPVNEAIEKLFGYNLEVFDATNACLQGQVEALSDKTPAERKKMVDRTIGLDSIDRVIKKAHDKVVTDKATCNALESTIQPVQQPEEPEVLVFPEQLAAQEVKYKEYLELKSWITNTKVDEPEVFIPTIMASMSDLVTAQATYDDIKRKVEIVAGKLEGLPTEFTSSSSKSFEERFEALQKWDEYQRHLSEYPEPSHTKEFIVEQRTRLEAQDNRSKHDNLRGRISDLEKDKTECPSCDHKFALEHAVVDKLREELILIPNFTGVDTPTASKTTLDMYEAMWEKYDNRPRVAVEEDPEDSLEVALREQGVYDNYQKYLELQSEYTALRNIEDSMINQAATIEQKREEDSKLAMYNVRQAKWLVYAEKKDVVEQRLEELEGIEDRITILRQQETQTQVYTAAMQRYRQDELVMAKRQAEVDDLQAKIKMNENVKKGLKELKPKVKMYLIPSLNKVSSTLISQMTQGERSQIQIDEEFNIKVDGQAIEELSGSGKSVANLAIRIGLGTILTNKVFSVFLADEVDAAMDKNRASYTAECLRNLKSTIGQIVIVSHQQPEADHQIELRK